MLNKLVFIIRKINLKKKKILLFELFCVVLLVINILLSFSLTFLFAQIVNKLFVEKTNCILDLYLLISITLLNSILSYLKSYLIQNVGKEISFSLKTYLYQEILYNPFFPQIYDKCIYFLLGQLQDTFCLLHSYKA